MLSKPPPVTLPNSECHYFESSIVNDTYKLNISLPIEYDSSDATYPVVYATDGGGAIFSLSNIAELLFVSGELPPLIIVGIGYPIEGPDKFWFRRQRDYDPVSDNEEYAEFLDYFQLDSIKPGGAGTFLEFIQEELKPFINSHYRTSHNDNTYVGVSDGGLFGLYTLFHHPRTFSRYVIGSPSIYRGNLAVLTYEQNYAANHDDLPVKMFLCVGGLEESNEPNEPFAVIQPSNKYVTNMKTLTNTLKKRNYSNLQLTSHIFENETHLSVIPATYSRGLREVFRGF